MAIAAGVEIAPRTAENLNWSSPHHVRAHRKDAPRSRAVRVDAQCAGRDHLRSRAGDGELPPPPSGGLKEEPCAWARRQIHPRSDGRELVGKACAAGSSASPAVAPLLRKGSRPGRPSDGRELAGTGGTSDVIGVRLDAAWRQLELLRRRWATQRGACLPVGPISGLSLRLWTKCQETQKGMKLAALFIQTCCSSRNPWRCCRPNL
jgi:hypothetical protein